MHEGCQKPPICQILEKPIMIDLFASGSTDNLVIIWDVAEQKVIAKLDNTKGIRITGIYFIE